MAKKKLSSKVTMKNLGTKSLAMKKIYYLHNLALKCRNIKLIKYYNREIVEIAHKTVLRLDPTLKQIMCKKCYNWVNSKLVGKELHCTCECGFLKIYPLKNCTRYTDDLELLDIPM